MKLRIRLLRPDRSVIAETVIDPTFARFPMARCVNGAVCFEEQYKLIDEPFRMEIVALEESDV